jgi:hypothetical protein
MDQPHKLVVNTEGIGGILGVAAESRAPNDHLDFQVKQAANAPQPYERPHRRSPSPRVPSPPPQRRHEDVSFDGDTLDVSGLANPQKQRQDFFADPHRHDRTRYRSWTRSRSRSQSRAPSPAPPPAPPLPVPLPETKPSPGFSSIREEKLYIILSLKRMRAEGVDHTSDFQWIRTSRRCAWS